MRVITGSAKGRKLEQLSGNDVRPTTERVKEAVFSSLQFQIEGRQFLDLFAGSGQMGIEALSRGASRAVFTDLSKDSIEIVKRNLKTTKLEECARVYKTDSIGFLTTCREKFDLAFIDAVEAPNVNRTISLDTLFDIAEALDVPPHIF